ncbi:anti-sigma factor domain-containing protein [Rhodococcus sp. NPDC127528]|uniref:anti-sigma factor n=1 Tax=unclassified Rhodococcus (in: high G+C Gram-positive bacteria) TaxID=192944 RepID=UPI00363E3EDE
MSESPTGAERDLLDLAYPYALGAVSETDRAEIAGRLGAAAPHTAHAFARIVADTHEIMALVGGGDALAPPPELRSRILAAVEDEAEAVATDELAHRRRRRLTRALAAAAAVVVVAVAAVVVTGRLTEHTPPEPTVAQVMSSPDTHTVSADVAGGTVTVSASEQANAVVVSMADVPPPPTGHVYQMWFVPESGAPRSGGTMSATTMPPPGGEVIPDLDSATAVAVTVEPGTGSPQPTGTPVVTIALA